MATVYRGLSGSQYVYSTDSPPENAENIVVVFDEQSDGGVNRGQFETIFDLPNVSGSSNIEPGLNIGDYAIVVSLSSGRPSDGRFFCTFASQGAASWSQLHETPPGFSDDLVAWWEADRGIELSGTGVLEWKEWSGNELVLTSSDGEMPSFTTTSSPFGAVSFNGSTFNRLCGGNILNLGETSLTFFIALKAPTPSATSTILTKRESGLGFGSGPAGYVFENFGASANYLNSGIDNAQGNSASPGGTSIGWAGDVFHVITGQMNRALGQIRFFTDRDDANASSTSAALIGWNITGSSDFAVGNTSNLYDEQRPFAGDIYAILAYRAVITGSKREAIQEYLRKRWISEDEFSY